MEDLTVAVVCGGGSVGGAGLGKEKRENEGCVREAAEGEKKPKGKLGKRGAAAYVKENGGGSSCGEGDAAVATAEGGARDS
jgi:hypothetical protein